MTKTIKAICIILGIICSINAVFFKKDNENVLAKDQKIKGVWAATLYSMDYPKSPSANYEGLKAAADDLISDTAKHGFNTLFLQVRPTGDAFYKSEIFPWSKYLTGEEALEPKQGFDPLRYITDEAHKKGISVHAWINPFRITASENDLSELSDKNISKKFPHLVVKNTDNKLYLNPGEPEAVQLVIDGALELARNYPIDGLHIDDYFYPSAAFPDNEAFTKYGGAFSDIGDWRRDNITQFVKKLGHELKKVNPRLVFSVSPCGIWANKSSSIEGSDTAGKQAYYDYYADTRLWVKEELIDLIIPQIYWSVGYQAADFEELSKWWNDTVDGTNVSLCIGQGIYRIAEETNPSSDWYKQKGFEQIEKQLVIIDSLENTSGFVQYRLGSITATDGLSEFLKAVNSNKSQLFTDINAYPWAKEAVERLHSKGIINGMGDGSFGGGKNITRADFTVMLVRLSKQNVPFIENFSDVTKDKYYYDEVGIAKALGFANGREDNIFDPSGNISREDMATLVWRFLVRTGKIKEKSRLSLASEFSDADEISEYARIAVAALVEKGFLNGYETGAFKPKGLATRAECACLLDKLLEN